MSITRASEDAGDKTEYCTVQDVRIHLAGVGEDDAGDPFAAFWGADIFDQKVAALLPIAKREVDKMAQRDFCYHKEVDIYMDGTGGQYLPFHRFGFVPLLEVKSLTVEGDEQNLDDFVVYQDGRFGSKTWLDTDDELASNTWMWFPLGRQNIELTITWGYEDVPADIMLASVFMVGHFLAVTMDAIQDRQKPGMLSGMTSVRYGDMTLGVGGIGVYERLAKRLKDAARARCGEYFTPIVTAPRPRKSQLTIVPFGWAI